MALVGDISIDIIPIIVMINNIHGLISNITFLRILSLIDNLFLYKKISNMVIINITISHFQLRIAMLMIEPIKVIGKSMPLFRMFVIFLLDNFAATFFDR